MLGFGLIVAGGFLAFSREWPTWVSGSVLMVTGAVQLEGGRASLGYAAVVAVLFAKAFSAIIEAPRPPNKDQPPPAPR